MKMKIAIELESMEELRLLKQSIRKNIHNLNWTANKWYDENRPAFYDRYSEEQIVTMVLDAEKLEKILEKL